MKTLVSATHRAYSGRVRDAVEAKLALLGKYFDRILSVRALLDRQNDVHRVELVAHVGRGATLVVDASSDTFDLALDQALTRMKSLLTRHKRRLVQRHRRVKKPNR